ncbi:MAG: HAMP domain-containing histidine kinase [Erysipelotrichales bacterium]|nr:HAMP domain-containing histidine kinase [Erysipelotrichales bacterium]
MARMQSTLNNVIANPNTTVDEEFAIITWEPGSGFEFRGRDLGISVAEADNISNLLSTLPTFHEVRDLFFVGVRQNNRIIIIATDHSYINSLRNRTLLQTLYIFIPTLALGNIVVFFWGQKTVKKIKNIESGISIDSTIIKPINELDSLAESIIAMQNTIEENESIKREMLQNVSHDFKTPISVIRSYAEAVKEGVEGMEGLDVIIRQTENINRKVQKLIEITKLDYLEEVELAKCNLKEIIESILLNYKHEKITIETDLVETFWIGNDDYYYSIFDNLIDNACRYGKSLVKIILNDCSFSVFNDGEKIAENFIDKMFLPYEKSFNGQTGLGLSIVKRITSRIDLNITVNNLENGVEFLISKRK